MSCDTWYKIQFHAKKPQTLADVRSYLSQKEHRWRTFQSSGEELTLEVLKKNKLTSSAEMVTWGFDLNPIRKSKAGVSMTGYSWANENAWNCPISGPEGELMALQSRFPRAHITAAFVDEWGEGALHPATFEKQYRKWVEISRFLRWRRKVSARTTDPLDLSYQTDLDEVYPGNDGPEVALAEASSCLPALQLPTSIQTLREIDGMRPELQNLIELFLEWQDGTVFYEFDADTVHELPGLANYLEKRASDTWIFSLNAEDPVEQKMEDSIDHCLVLTDGTHVYAFKRGVSVPPEVLAFAKVADIPREYPCLGSLEWELSKSRFFSRKGRLPNGIEWRWD